MGVLDNWKPGAKRPIINAKYRHYHPKGDGNFSRPKIPRANPKQIPCLQNPKSPNKKLGRDYFMSFKSDAPMITQNPVYSKTNRCTFPLS